MALRPGAQLTAFIRLGRPLFLVGGFLFHALGIAMALYQGRPLNLAALILGQLAITSAQLMTHYSNDYFDLETDRANRDFTFWSGGSRVLPDGLLTPRVALIAARVLAGISLAATAALGLLVHAAVAPLLILLLGLVLAWSYSAPPARLCARGFGELTAALLVPCMVTLVGLLLQGGSLTGKVILPILPLILFQFAMLLGIEFPDSESDAGTGKGTLVVRLGGETAAILHTLVLVAAFMAMLFGAVLIAVRGDFPLAALLLGAWIVTLPFGLWHGSRVAGGAWCDPLQWGSVAFWGIALLVATGGLELAAFAIMALNTPALKL